MNAQQSTGTQPDTERPAAAHVFETMRRLVLEQEDRRAEVSEALGMSFIRSKALRRLVDGPLRMRELTVGLATDKPYTTLIVDDLERRGLVRRSVDPGDRRCKIVTITDSGRQAAELAEAILARPPKSLLALDAEELTTLERLLAKL
ncbi:MarR family transcriptional regulator [Streptacidiphilus sp. PB12-B1b]|uniref:MarR family winged helix-turn-helix transcriptional regulator n=1 Tax=Streptacidiphilus sp. PB12-B1b TaxID=2705012 RepID=UPI0015FB04E2|nr:MarR family transcriptional regulator [Streptacidiphilus sp. PB12-B1b]QMU74447.1 MarR family transcriptional regulator [Streptacidiphilus sp. PB12-B1b]